MGRPSEGIAKISIDDNTVEIVIRCSKPTFREWADLNQPLWDKVKKTP